LAEERAAEALAYIAADRPSAAAKWLRRVLASVEALAELPDRGRAIPELGRPEIREVIIRPYRVMYRREPKRIIVLTIRHGRRAFAEDEVTPEA
jgi:plasmid stabilization system protein ParE